MTQTTPLAVVAAVISDSTGQILCAQKDRGPHAGQWEFPGGKVEQGETPPDALVREIEEELGCPISVGDRHISTAHSTPDLSLILTTYRCTLTGVPPVAREHRDIRWLPAAALNTLDWAPADRPAVDALVSEATHNGTMTSSPAPSSPAPSSLTVEVVRVFTTAEGDLGNELGIVLASAACAGREQQIAASLGFSETVFISALTPEAATMRIFTPGSELPFAGHPSVGTAWWLANRGTPVEALEVPAGRVSVRIDGETVWISGRGEWAPPFAFTRLPSAAEVDALTPSDFQEGKNYFYAWTDEPAGALRSRLFASAIGVAEDQATGSAAIRLSADLGRDLSITQGLGCLLTTRHVGDGVIEVGGRTVWDRTINLPV
ncbi:MAG: PhzF family phenazine biosynthesis protein [Mycetocola sp.]